MLAQLREFKPRSLIQVLTRIQELGLASRGAGCDNVRNVTASPNSAPVLAQFQQIVDKLAETATGSATPCNCTASRPTTRASWNSAPAQTSSSMLSSG